MNQESKRFFKIIATSNSWFSHEYNITCLDDIYAGQVFTARGKPYEWCVDYTRSGRVKSRVSVQHAQPMIHFCDNAIDLLVWYHIGLGPLKSYSETYFFEVRPLSDVVKQRCKDKNRLYQCGAQQIEIVKQLTVGELCRIAGQEVSADISEIMNRYPDINMMRFVMMVQNKNDLYK